MDQIVIQAMAKWPTVPHCYGWLMLDARGNWRMRDERTQALGLMGEKIVHQALLGFINRNYAPDARGCWYFQNGPQRVYVNLEATPHIVRTDPLHGFVLHTGETYQIDSAWLTDTGQLLLQNDEQIALVDDRDLMRCMDQLEIAGLPASEQELFAWMAGQYCDGELCLRHRTRVLPVRHVMHDALAARFGFVPSPQP